MPTTDEQTKQLTRDKLARGDGDVWRFETFRFEQRFRVIHCEGQIRVWWEQTDLEGRPYWPSDPDHKVSDRSGTGRLLLALLDAVEDLEGHLIDALAACNQRYRPKA